MRDPDPDLGIELVPVSQPEVTGQNESLQPTTDSPHQSVNPESESELGELTDKK